MARARSSKPIPPAPRTLTRLERVEELLVQGTRTMQLVALVAEEFEVTERQVLDDVAKVRDRWAAESEAGRPRKRAELEAQVEDLYGRCIAANDRKSAVQALQLKADLHGARIRPMAAIVKDGETPKSIDAWLSGVLGFGGAPEPKGPQGEGG
jgi:hypothetical protein